MWSIATQLCRLIAPAAFGAALGGVAAPPPFARETSARPNILVIMADDIGHWNISAYNRGMTGYGTPNIDRLAEEGCIFTDYDGQQSCTVGRAAFITGQSPQGRPAGCERGAVAPGPDHGRPAEAAGLRHRPVRQEPFWQPQ
jgi:hypothetical protein